MLGANGAGKTTVLQFLSGVLEARSGVLLSAGDRIDPAADSWRRQLSYVPDDGGTIPLLTVAEQLHLQRAFHGVSGTEAEQRTDTVVGLLGLQAFRNLRGDALSVGTRKRLGVALAIIRDARVFLLDEPFAALDAQAVETARGVLKVLSSRRRTVILASHSPAFLQSLANRVWMVRDGVVEDHADPAVVAAFLAAQATDLPSFGHDVLSWIPQ